MPLRGWKQLLADPSWFRGEGNYPLPAYSEFMPPARVGRKPLGELDHALFSEDDPWGWRVTEFEENAELRPGLELIARQLLTALRRLGHGESAHGIARQKLAGNPCWPDALQKSAAPAHERYVLVAPVALSRTQDDKGRIRWTLFGGSEQGPARAFWKSFYMAPGRELPADQGIGFFRRLLAAAYHESGTDPLRRLGFRIYAGPDQSSNGATHAGGRRRRVTRRSPDKTRSAAAGGHPELPSWAAEYLWTSGHSLRSVRYLFTFQPFARLPAAVRKAYLAGDLHILPFPGSLLFWEAPPYSTLAKQLPLAMQIPLLHSIERHTAPIGIRVPQSGWIHEPREDSRAFDDSYGPLRNLYRRTHRGARVRRDEDELTVTDREDKVAHVLFSTAAEDLGLYGKPMARNAQLWSDHFELLLDGPNATRDQLYAAAERLEVGGLFGYRFMFPAMHAGRYEVYWHRPIVAYLSPTSGEPTLLDDAPLGWLTGYRTDRRSLNRPIELWPRLLARPPYREALESADWQHDPRHRQTALNIRKLLDTWHLVECRPLPRSFARQLLTLSPHETLDGWLDALPDHATKPEVGGALKEALTTCLESATTSADTSRAALSDSLTYRYTARRSFEVAYWRTIDALSAGRFPNIDTADVVRDPVTLARVKHDQNDLHALGDHVLKYYKQLVAERKMSERVLVGALPFRWRTDFEFNWSGGWLDNQYHESHERDLMVVIPGRDRRRAVIMADHYDTAYMEDEYGYPNGGHGPRLAAAGADDNHSATAALMLAAPILLELSRAGRLQTDIWLVHLTGEEFPADCLGARHLCQCLVEERLRLRRCDGRWRNLSRTHVQGVYVLDMVAHNNDHQPDVFQICPGTDRGSMWLAEHAHVANRIWNELAPQWNRRAGRRGRGRRSPDPRRVPAMAEHPRLSGEIRPAYDPRSTLYNTDGQIFSDVGVPVVLFMENYDINRHGYHDSHDTMANIDLDYGAALAAIAIETVARAASEPATG